MSENNNGIIFDSRIENFQNAINSIEFDIQSVCEEKKRVTLDSFSVAIEKQINLDRAADKSKDCQLPDAHLLGDRARA